MAVVFALIGLFTFALLQWNARETIAPALANQTKKNKTDSVAEPKVTSPTLTQKEEQTIQPDKRKLTHSNSRKSIPRLKKQIDSPQTMALAFEENPVAIVRKEETTVTSDSVIPSVVARKSMKLTFSLPTLESKTEEPKEVIVAEVNEDKKSTLQKAADAARELRSSDVLGSLREAKNDLFALEFKNDKTKKQQ